VPFPLHLAMIADDLTGALDAVVVFANVGLRCVVATSPAHVQAAMDQRPDVIAISTNSRDLSGADAALAVAKVTKAVQDAPIVFKKIDSRLKGNIAAEVAALAQLLGTDRALLCPAIPQMGRTVVDGLLQGFGVDRAVPVGNVLAQVAGLSVQVRDAVTDADIDEILLGVSAQTLLVGARGLSDGVARRMARQAPKPITLPLPRPIAFVIGSRDPITLAQVAHLRHSHPGATFIAAPNGRACGGAAGDDVVILQATAGADPVTPEAVTQALAQSCQRTFATAPACLVLTGGETAAAVLAAIGVGVLEVVGEVLPGLPLCRALGFETSPLIVTKSGGFGAVDALSLLAGCNPNPEASR
jgi:D-threonate/D-erythronate kinase